MPDPFLHHQAGSAVMLATKYAGCAYLPPLRPTPLAHSPVCRFAPAYELSHGGHREPISSRRRSRGVAQCSLTICRDHTLRRLLPSQFTGDQWKYYWGITETDKFGRLYEAMSMTFFGLWTSWFLTFMIGLPLATVLGTIFLFYWILAPGLAAYRRNVSFRGMKFARHLDDDGVFGALFSGRVIRVGRIMQNREYNRPETFVMSVEDEQGRKLRVYAPVLPSYKRVRVGMRCAGIVLSSSPDFNDLEGVSDLFVPACGAWVGDYPYLDKIRFRAFLADRIRRQGGGRRRRPLPGPPSPDGMFDESREGLGPRIDILMPDREVLDVGSQRGRE